MKTRVDIDTCIGCGLCPSVAPDIYEMRDDGKAHEMGDTVPAGQESSAQEAVDSCPVSAIIIDEP